MVECLFFSASATVFAGDSRGLSTRWQLRNMVQTGSDPFHYIEAEWDEGPIQNLSVGEFLCMVLPKTNDIKGLAIVNYEDRSRASLLRTKSLWDNSLGQVGTIHFPLFYVAEIFFQVPSIRNTKAVLKF